jgi:alpha-tubulin suppressor-like RCC1 family protein
MNKIWILTTCIITALVCSCSRSGYQFIDPISDGNDNDQVDAGIVVEEDDSLEEEDLQEESGPPVVMRDGPCGTQVPDPWYPSNSMFIAAGHYHTCILLADQTLRCWGQAGFGQVGNESQDDIGDDPNEMGENLAIVNLGATNYLRLFGGGYHNCVLFDDQGLKCWGINSEGQLGLGDADNRGNQPGDMGANLPWLPQISSSLVYDLVMGRHTVCAIFEDDSVKCWGGNRNGQLGYGDTENRGDAPGEISTSLPTVDLGSESTPFKLVGGFDHMCALMMNGKIKCWGDNTHGQLGLGDVEDRGDQPGEMGDALGWVDLGSDYCAIDIAAGLRHNCAVLLDGGVKCWGTNNEGALGLGDTKNRGDDISSLGDNLANVDLGSGRTALAVGAGQESSCALLDNHTVKCWGRNARGQLGQGHALIIGDEPGEMGDALPSIELGINWIAERLYVGREYACTTHGALLKCWGDHLGAATGSDNNLGDEPGEMGDALPLVDLP